MNSVSTLNASNIDDALSALELTNKSVDTIAGDIDRHPERRFKKALEAYEAQRLPELKNEHKGLRLNQYRDIRYKEFQKSDENPMNKIYASYNTSRAHLKDIAASQREKLEFRLGQ